MENTLSCKKNLFASGKQTSKLNSKSVCFTPYNPNKNLPIKEFILSTDCKGKEAGKFGSFTPLTDKLSNFQPRDLFGAGSRQSRETSESSFESTNSSFDSSYTNLNTPIQPEKHYFMNSKGKNSDGSK